MGGIAQNLINLRRVVQSLLFFLWASLSIYGQLSDSTVQQIKALAEDSSRMRFCLGYYDSLLYSDPVKSLDFTRYAFKLAHSSSPQVEESLQFASGIALTSNFGVLGIPDSQYHYLQIMSNRHADYLKTTPDKRAAFYQSMGAYHHRVKQLDSADIYNALSISAYYEADDSISAASVLLNQVQVWTKNYQERKAIDALIEVLDFAQAKSDSILLARANFNLGYINLSLKQFEKAAAYFEDSKQYVRSLYPRKSIFNNLGSTYLSLKDTIKALSMYQKAHELDIQLNGSMAASDALLGIGIISLYHKKQAHEAVQMLNKCLKVAQEKDNPSLQASILCVLADAYLQTEQSTKARHCATKAHKIAQGHNFPDKKTMALRALARVEAATNNMQLAYQYMQQYTIIQDELHEKARAEEVTEAEIRYQSIKKEQENALLKQENFYNEQQIVQKSKQIWLLIMLVCAVGLAIILLLSSYYRRQKLNQKLRVKNEQLQELNYKKDLMVRMVSHDLRTPLGYIYNWIEMLRQIPAIKDHRFGNYLNDILKSVEHLEMVTSRILRSTGSDGNQVIDIKANVFDLRKALQSWIYLMEPEAKKKNIFIDLKLPDNPVIICSDIMLNQQCIDNLVSNAIKYTPEGGKVSIRLKEPLNDMVVIDIEDNGKGILEEVQKQIFEPFFNTPSKSDDEIESFGLGLYNVKQYLQLLNGRISLKSSLGKGSLFRIEWPVYT